MTGASGAVPPEIDAMFPPRPSSLCSWCDFRRHCAEGQAAGSAHQPWDALIDRPITDG
jgi:hypothetical protein